VGPSVARMTPSPPTDFLSPSLATTARPTHQTLDTPVGPPDGCGTHTTMSLVVGGDTDEGIPTFLPSSIDGIAGRVDVQHKPNDLCIGPITR
jgi:hypothetical protein